MAAPALDAGVDLTASLVAIWQATRDRLSAQTPTLGGIRDQALAAAAANEDAWLGFSGQAVAHLVGQAGVDDPDLADRYARNLGRVIAAEAIQGLVAGMDLQLGKGWAPEVAWQRALLGYGLDPALMRWYLTAAMKQSGEGNAGIIPGPLRAAVQHALCRRAETLVAVELRAWSGLEPAKVAKKFDPAQLRDPAGQWTAEPTAPAMAAALNADRRTYVDDLMRAWRLDLGSPQHEARWAFEEKFGEPGKLLSAAVDDWVGHAGVSRARHVEHATQDPGRRSQKRLQRVTPNHRVLLDALRSAPPTDIPLYRGASYADVGKLRRGATIRLPITSFSATAAGAERFAWKGWLQRKKQPVVFELLPGAHALNLTPLTTMGVSPNEWIANGRFRVVSARPEKREIRIDPAAKKGKIHDILHVRLRHLPPAAKVSKAGYDPNERRNQRGRWATTNTGAPPVAERKPDAALEELLANPVDSPATEATPSRYTKPEGRYSRYTAASRYSTPYAEPQSRYTTGSRYTTVDTPYTQAARQQQRRIVERRLLVLLAGGKKVGQPTPEPPEEEAAPGTGPYYVPMSTLADYYGTGNASAFDTEHGERIIDFSPLADFYDEPIGVQRAQQPWDVVAEAADIPQDRWEGALNVAVPLWHKVMVHIDQVGQHLTDHDLDVIAARAGYDPAQPEAFREQIFNDIQARADKSRTYDPSLLQAVADYVIWSQPDVMRKFSEDPANAIDEDDLRDLQGARTRIGLAKLNSDELIPSVINFAGGLHGHDARDPSDLRGMYQVRVIDYHSAIGALGKTAPIGVIGLQEVSTRPHQRRPGRRRV